MHPFYQRVLDIDILNKIWSVFQKTEGICKSHIFTHIFSPPFFFLQWVSYSTVGIPLSNRFSLKHIYANDD